MTKFLLDSGDPDEYREISQLAKDKGSELWGATTNPTLIAKKLAGKKISSEEAFALQKKIVFEILSIVPGAVSAEVYADDKTTSEQMIEQGRDIATWHERIYVKLPTTVEGFKARTALRREGIAINNTLVFSQEQIFAICLHEKLIEQTYQPKSTLWPQFISPFMGRLDDLGQQGLSLIVNGVKIEKELFPQGFTWILAASIRNTYHFEQCIKAGSDIVTVPAKIYKEWFNLSREQRDILQPTSVNLQPIPYWQPSEELQTIASLDEFMHAITTNKLNIFHTLTEKGIERFTADWNAIIA